MPSFLRSCPWATQASISPPFPSAYKYLKFLQLRSTKTSTHLSTPFTLHYCASLYRQNTGPPTISAEASGAVKSVLRQPLPQTALSQVTGGLDGACVSNRHFTTTTGYFHSTLPIWGERSNTVLLSLPLLSLALSLLVTDSLYLSKSILRHVT